MKLYALERPGRAIIGCAIIEVGDYRVSISNVFPSGGDATIVYHKDADATKPLKCYSTNRGDDVAKAIAFAERRMKRK